MRLTLLSITLLVSLILVSMIQQAESAPFLDLLSNLKGNNNNNNNGGNAIEFSTTSGSNDNSFLSRIQSAFQILGAFFSSFMSTIKGNSGGSSSSSSISSSVDDDPDFDFSYFDNLDSNTISKRDNMQSTDAPSINVNSVDSIDFPDAFDLNPVEKDTRNELVSVSTAGDTAVNVDGILSLNGRQGSQRSINLVDVKAPGDTSVNVGGIFSLNGNADVNQRTSLVTVNARNNNARRPNFDEKPRTLINIPGLFNLDIGGSDVDSRTSSLVSVRTGSSGTRVRAPFVDVSA